MGGRSYIGGSLVVRKVVLVKVDISESGEEGKSGWKRMGRKKREEWWRRVCRKKNGERERGSKDNQITETVDEMEETLEKGTVLYCVRDGDGWGNDAGGEMWERDRLQKERQKTRGPARLSLRPQAILGERWRSWTWTVVRVRSHSHSNVCGKLEARERGCETDCVRLDCLCLSCVDGTRKADRKGNRADKHTADGWHGRNEV